MNIGLGIGVIIFSIVVISIPFISILRRGKNVTGSVKTQLISLGKDLVASILSLTGLFLVSQGYIWGDVAASFSIGLLIVLSGVYLFKENTVFLMGKSPGDSFIDSLVTEVRAVSGVLGVHDVRAEYISSTQIHAGLHIEVAANATVEEADKIVNEVESRLTSKIGCSYCVIHIDPYKK